MIPDYQRGYAWDDEQRNDLIEDIEDILRIRKQNPDKKYTHYTGTIVAKKISIGLNSSLDYQGETYDNYEIVDGQQRLTTLNIFLNEIAVAYEKIGDDDSLKTSQNIKKNYIAIKPDIHLKLNLNGTLGNFYAANILRESVGHITQQSEQNLLDAKNFFKKYLNNKSKMEGDIFLSSLNELRLVLTDCLGFLWHEVADDHEVSVIFETMNSRGKQLTQFEKVKNILFYIVGRNANDEDLKKLSLRINETWTRVLITLAGAPETDEDQFLRFFWAIFPQAYWFDEGKYKNQNDRASDIHRGIKESSKEDKFKNAPIKWLTNFLDGLTNYAPIYRDIQSPRTQGSFPFPLAPRQDFIDLCLSIDRIGRDANLIPLLMACYKQFMEKPEELKELFRLIEVFSFRLLLQGRYASTGRSKAFSLAAEIASNKIKNPEEVSTKIRTELIDTYCNDTQFVLRLNDKAMNFYDWSGINYFLFEYERFLSKENTLPINWDDFTSNSKDRTIEHILPQGENTLAKECWSKNFSTIEILKENVNRLGNLVLTDPAWNSSYSNKCFIEKQGKNAGREARVYALSMFQSERELVSYDDWSVVTIDQRQKKLVEFAKLRWPK